MTSGWVMFVLGGREMAGVLDEVREVVRATGIEGLTGTRAPVTGLLELRGTPVPVVDLRSVADPGDTGDVLVLTTEQGVIGMAVDRVSSVCGPADLVAPGPDEPRPHGLPSYVVEVRRNAAGKPVLVVSLPALAGLVPA
jgi:chemotaxis signal transduction protein